MSPARRVFVRGVGAWTPLGATWPATADALAVGRSAIAPIATFDTRGFPCTVAAAIADAVPEGDRRTQLALRAADEAWREANVSAPSERTGVFIGAESARVPWGTVHALTRAAGGGHTFDAARFGVAARPLGATLDAAGSSPGAVASALARRIGAEGPAATTTLACASGSAAIVEAVRALRAGECDVALCGGVGADIDPLMLAAFCLLGALSTRGVSCPFDSHRDGFVLGEGAAMAVLSVERPAGPAVEVAGVARTLDAKHLTAPDPNADGATRAMIAALEDAGAPHIGYVQAHATSTPIGDASEAHAIRRALGRAADTARVASAKGALGHSIAAAGAIGLLCATQAVSKGTLLPTVGLRSPDTGCALRHVVGEAFYEDVEAALANAFGFGGANACIVVRRA